MITSVDFICWLEYIMCLTPLLRAGGLVKNKHGKHKRGIGEREESNCKKMSMSFIVLISSNDNLQLQSCHNVCNSSGPSRLAHLTSFDFSC